MMGWGCTHKEKERERESGRNKEVQVKIRQASAWNLRLALNTIPSDQFTNRRAGHQVIPYLMRVYI